MSRTLLCSCGKRFSSSADEGQTVRCPHCKAGIQVPRRDPKRSGALKVEAPGLPSSQSSDKRSLKKPRSWLRLLAWLIPALACVVLIVLILAVPGLRRRVVVPPAPAPADPLPAVVEPQPAPEQTDLEVPEPPQPSLESSEPGLEVLPPLATQTAGRRVPKQLLVGRRAGMFASVEDAVAVAIPGDVIEIRTNQPMLVGGAVLRVKDKLENAPLTIRAGKGYQPILRVAAETSFLRLFNVDLVLMGIHFVTSVKHTYLHPAIGAENSHVTLSRCTLTAIPGTATRFQVFVWNSRGTDKTFRISLSHCFVRGYRAGPVVWVRNPAIAVSFDESAIIGGKIIWCQPVADKQSISFRHCTLLGSHLHVNLVDKELTNPASFQMERSISTTIGHYDDLFLFGYEPRAAFDTFEKRDKGLRARFREFKAGDSAACFHRGWAHEYPAVIEGGQPVNRHLKEAVVGDLPQQDQTIQLGQRVEAIRAVLQQKDLPNAADLLDTLLPQDLTPSSTGFLGLRLSQGIRYGADLNKLPAPPAATLTPYQADSLIVADPSILKVRQQSEPFPLQLITGDVLRQVRGVAAKPGQWADLLIPVPQAGKWSVRARLLRDPPSGIVKFTLNGEPAGKEVDLFAPEPSSLPAVDLGEHTLPRGEINLRVETVGSSPNAPKPGFQFGIEHVVLRRVGKK